MKSCLIFLAGAVVGFVAGAAATYKYLQKKVSDESEQILETYSVSDILKKDSENVDKKDVDIVEQSSYAQYMKKVKETTETDDVSDIYVIQPQDFGEEWGEDGKITLYWTADDVLCDENLEKIEHYRDTVGDIDVLSTFGTSDVIYSDDCVYVRNHKKKCDYEILRSDRLWAEDEEARNRWTEET